jgi:hypothetical protein
MAKHNLWIKKIYHLSPSCNNAPDSDPSRFAAADRVQPVHDAGRYLSKYLSKPKQLPPEPQSSGGAGTWFPSSWWFCDSPLRSAIANSVVKFRLTNPSLAELHALFSAVGFFNLIVREERPVGWVAFVPPNLLDWLTTKLSGEKKTGTKQKTFKSPLQRLVSWLPSPRFSNYVPSLCND